MYDLHTHSNCSDGLDAPELVVEKAAALGCTLFALTDHDTVSGVSAALARARELALPFLAGCEIEAKYADTLHILALGVPTHTEGIGKVCIVGGGVGCAIAMPVAQEFHRLGAEVTSIIGFRSKELLILEDEFRACSDRLTVMTDDGSYARQGNVTAPLKEMLEADEDADLLRAVFGELVRPLRGWIKKNAK